MNILAFASDQALRDALLPEKPKMTASAERTLFWTPRTLLVLLTLFVSVFALDVFGEGLGFWKTLVALGMHLIPTFALLLVFAVVWKSEPLGGALLAGLGVLYILRANPGFRWGVLLVMGGIPVVTGVLFWLHWWILRHKPPARSTAWVARPAALDQRGFRGFT